MGNQFSSEHSMGSGLADGENVSSTQNPRCHCHPDSDTSQGSLAVSPPRPVSFWLKWPHRTGGTKCWGLRSFLENSGCFVRVGELCTCWQSLGMLNFHQGLSHQDFALSQPGNKCNSCAKLLV